MMLSILHRATGVAPFMRSALLAWWLKATASGPEFTRWCAIFLALDRAFGLFGYSWALFHHMFGGVRHFIWDTGRGFDLKTEIIARATAIAPRFSPVWHGCLAYVSWVGHI